MKGSQHKTNDDLIANATEQSEQNADMQHELSTRATPNVNVKGSANLPEKDECPSIVGDFEPQKSNSVPITDVKVDDNVDNDSESAAKKGSRLRKDKSRALSYLIKIAILSAIGVVLLAIEFPLFPATPWLELNVSDFPTLIASFMFGPLSGAIVNAVKIAISLFLWQTSTGFVGEMSNLISGTLYALIAGSIYILHRNKKGAIVALVISSAVFCLTMTLCNRYFLLPMYGMDAKPAVYGIMAWTVLFNVVKTVITSVVTFYVYKRTRRVFDRF